MNLETLVPREANPNVAEFQQGDTVRVSHRIVEGDRERVQHFEGDLPAVSGQVDLAHSARTELGLNLVGTEMFADQVPPALSSRILAE